MEEEQGVVAPQKPKPERKESSLLEILKFALVAALIVIPTRMYIAKPFIVSGASMDPTFKTGQYLIVDQLTYRFESPHRGDVVIFRYPRNPKKFFIKRIIGLPGERINVREGRVFIIDTTHSSETELLEPYITHHSQESLSITLSAGEYFVMGDNRAESSDSRYWGPLQVGDLIGRPIIRLIPLSNFSTFPGAYALTGTEKNL